MKLLILLFLAFVGDVQPKRLPEFIPQCKRNEPEYIRCILSAIDKVRPNLQKGIPEINVPPLEPLDIPDLAIDRDLTALKVKAQLPKMRVHGGSNFKVKNLKINLKDYTADVAVSIPKLFVTSNYDVSGRLLLIPLAGEGTLEGNFTDCTATIKGSAKVVELDGEKYLQLIKFNAKISVGGGRVKFNDDGRNVLIAETAAGFFNLNPKLVLGIISPIIEDVTTTIFMPMVDKMLLSIPLSELIPED